MEDVSNSLKQALVRQGWLYTDRQRTGNPFQWVDNDQTPWMNDLKGVHSALLYLAMFYEQYPTPSEILTQDYDEMREYTEGCIRKFYEHAVPFLDSRKSGMEVNIVCTAMTRLQDYCSISTFCSDLGKSINHLDIGPGLGSHATYSLKALSSCYYARDASPLSYSAQRQFFRYLTQGEATYLDLVDCEKFDLGETAMSEAINDTSKYRIKHVPSWYFQLIQDESIDLVTASWVLNELSTAGILWLIANAMRVLREGGYFYIRDSGELKPGRHEINYDDLLQKMGFVEVGRLDVRNRVDFFGIPRAYQKQNSYQAISYDELFDLCLGKLAVTVFTGSYDMNLTPEGRQASEPVENPG